LLPGGAPLPASVQGMETDPPPAAPSGRAAVRSSRRAGKQPLREAEAGAAAPPSKRPRPSLDEDGEGPKVRRGGAGDAGAAHVARGEVCDACSPPHGHTRKRLPTAHRLAATATLDSAPELLGLRGPAADLAHPCGPLPQAALVQPGRGSRRWGRRDARGACWRCRPSARAAWAPRRRRRRRLLHGGALPLLGQRAGW